MLTVVSMGCSRKTVPVITARNAAPPQKRIIYAAPGIVTADTVTGKTLFMSYCNRCHGLPEPALYPANRWEDILESMLPRTRASATDAVHLRAYVLARTVN